MSADLGSGNAFGSVREVASPGVSGAISTADRLLLARQLGRATERLRTLATEPVCVAILGERNAGKSTVANRLIGTDLMPTAIIASTRFPTLIRYATSVSLHAILSDGERVTVATEDDVADRSVVLLEIGVPSRPLLGLAVLDTPAGFSPAALPGLPGIGRLIVPVWCTVATQAWKATEAAAWAAMPATLRRRGMLAVTGFDRVIPDTQRTKLAERLAAEAGPAFKRIGFSPEATGVGVALETAVYASSREAVEHRRATLARLAARLNRLRGAVMPARLG